jgi:hypothetical protein
VTLAVTAGATSRVRLGTTVLIVPYRNPVVTAKMVSTLDALSGGRVVLGVGAGWLAEESAALGVPFAERGPMTDEYLAAMRELWTSPAPSFAGKYTQFSGLQFEPKPVQKPHPPICRRPRPRPLRRASGSRRRTINRSAEELREDGRIWRGKQARGCGPPRPLRNDLRAAFGWAAATSVRGGSAPVACRRPWSTHRRAGRGGCRASRDEFLAADGPELDEQMALFAERIRPKLA